MKKRPVVGLALSSLTLLASSAFAFNPELVQSVQTPMQSSALNADQIVLKNDGFAEGGGQAFLQMGFVEGEMAGVFVTVPKTVELFKVEYFRVLLGDSSLEMSPASLTVYFQMGALKASSPASPTIPMDIENAASVTPGPYWNDIPAQGSDGESLGCVRGGDRIGAAIEFTHTGTPSIYRDMDGLSNIANNSIYAIPGGWGYSARYGVRGDWILRVVGHKATAEECQ